MHVQRDSIIRVIPCRSSRPNSPGWVYSGGARTCSERRATLAVAPPRVRCASGTACAGPGYSALRSDGPFPCGARQAWDAPPTPPSAYPPHRRLRDVPLLNGALHERTDQPRVANANSSPRPAGARESQPQASAAVSKPRFPLRPIAALAESSGTRWCSSPLLLDRSRTRP